jgi:hypothetical protein
MSIHRTSIYQWLGSCLMVRVRRPGWAGPRCCIACLRWVFCSRYRCFVGRGFGFGLVSEVS